MSLGLRQLWHEIENEPVPLEFLDLLDAIDAANRPGPAPAATPSGGTDKGPTADTPKDGDRQPQ